MSYPMSNTTKISHAKKWTYFECSSLLHDYTKSSNVITDKCFIFGHQKDQFTDQRSTNTHTRGNKQEQLTNLYMNKILFGKSEWIFVNILCFHRNSHACQDKLVWHFSTLCCPQFTYSKSLGMVDTITICFNFIFQIWCSFWFKDSNLKQKPAFASNF